VAAGAAFLIILPAQWTGAPGIRGQQPSTLTLELARALDRAGAAERVPVLIEVPRVVVPEPLAPDRLRRAAEHAGNLATAYASVAEDLRRSLPMGASLDPWPSSLLWIGGAVKAELTPDQIRSLQSSARVRRIYYDGLVEVQLSAPSHAPIRVWSPGLPLQDPAGGLPWGLQVIGAPEMWSAGATGEGTVIASIDSGVDGAHPLLWRKWRGLSIAPELAWFDPWGISEVPVDDEGLAGVGHGTFVMYTALGSLEPGDTLVTLAGPQIVQEELEVVTGVAPDAEWVAVNGFEGFGGGEYTRLSVLLQAMQWVVDPDHDPSTSTDIPDVLNNSWGFRSDGCNGVFDRAIDALELAGVPVVFSSGNRSAGLDTVAAPGQRADLLLNAFSVGAVEMRDGEIVVSQNSLGGPSPCGPNAIKPEVVAPGEVPVLWNRGARTAEVRGRSGVFTSWAAPHVSGSLALLAGLNPGASADELKDALYSTADDLPPNGPDNRSGNGLINLVAAANRIGGLGGVQIAVAGWAWREAGSQLSIKLLNQGTEPFLGGTAELIAASDESRLAAAIAPAIGPRARGEIVFAELPDSTAGARLRLRLESQGASLSIAIRLTAPSATGIVLTDGSVAFAVDGNGRLGGVASTPGFEFLGDDWLAGGAYLFESGARVSDAAYVDVLQQPMLKRDVVGSDTDWRNDTVDRQSPGRMSMSFFDGYALYPLGADVAQAAALVSLGDTAAFALLSSVAAFQSASNPLTGLLLDWDFAGRDSVGWDDGLGASVATAADSSGPWMALTALPAPATHAALPLGTPDGQFYEAGSGILSALEGFTDSEKSRFMRLGGLQSSFGGVSDWAQLVTVGPVTNGASTVFVIAAGRSRRALRFALDSARVVAQQAPPQPPIEPATAALNANLVLQPAYPNPFDPFDVDAIRIPFLVARGSDPVRATLRVYTVTGTMIYEERRQLRPESPLEPFEWNGRLSNGELAASGVYGYVIRVGDERKWGKFLLLK
jgi:subtilisin family serine protease